MPTRDWFTKKVVMPRWAIGVDFVWRIFLGVSAAVVMVLWFQAATRDEEADRNARIQACTTEYAATTAAFDGRVVKLDQEADALFADIIGAAAGGGDVPPELVADYREVRSQATQVGSAVDEMARRRIGLARFSADSVEEGNAFECPPIPDSLTVDPIYPRGYDPPR